MQHHNSNCSPAATGAGVGSGSDSSAFVGCSSSGFGSAFGSTGVESKSSSNKLLLSFGGPPLAVLFVRLLSFTSTDITAYQTHASAHNQQTHRIPTQTKAELTNNK